MSLADIRPEMLPGQFDKARETKRLKLDFREQPSSEHYSRPFCRSGIGRPTESPIMPHQAHRRAAVFHENAAKSHRTAAEYYGNNDHAKGDEHAVQARAYSRSARDHSEQTHRKGSTWKQNIRREAGVGHSIATGSRDALESSNGS
jgi:hypothetical protein